MIARTTKQFWSLYQALPPAVQELADKAYELWQNVLRELTVLTNTCGARRFAPIFGGAYSRQ